MTRKKRKREMNSEDSIVLGLRLSPAETHRYRRVYERAVRRNPYIRQTDVIRELIGLSEAVTLTDEEISYFRGGGELANEDDD